MTLSSFLTNLVIPLNLCIALLLVAAIVFMVRLRKTAFAIAVAGLCWAIFWSLPASSLWAGGRLEQLHPYTEASSAPTAQAIVVLGGHTANGRRNWFEPYDKETAIARIDKAAALYKAGRAPLIVVSGAALEGNVSEAQIMAHALEQHSIPRSAIIMESRSFTTHENAIYTAETLKQHHIQHILLVTSALHMPRAMAVFAKQGISAIATPLAPQIVVPDDPGFSFWQPDMRSLTASRSIVKEYVGLLVYWLRGWI
ncbi:YdcF family protein [Pollutimonas harenae]|uniref:YdcF family protein n=1 Tax=Pollutimonas harenae TaxID=657015 RepID=A0A853H3N1_9BURK|nr:YdcF family protein [Pollutimonas harenae]NYT86640.1 YdcF family protein [Pollutimonas harenae]TEA69622.1 YdcF family protein [Pollutimonas harenae]